MVSSSKRSLDIRPDVDPLPGRLARYAKYGIGYAAYINRPAIWPAIYRKVRDKLLGRIPDPQALRAMHAEASAWCAQRQTSTAEGIRKLGISTGLISVEQAHPDVFTEAKMRAGDIPVWMGGGSNLDLLYTLCRYLRPERIVETGVANGWSSLTFLLHLDSQKRGNLYSVDLPLMEIHNDRYVGIAVPESLRAPWRLYRMADREALPKIVRTASPIDLVYYDSDKSVEGRLFAYPLLWGSLRSGGMLVSDDIDDNMAFAHFCARIGQTPVVVKEPGSNAQGILVKP